MHELRAEFPVFERLTYLNAGTNGPVPRRALEAAEESLRRQAEQGRGDRRVFEVALEGLANLRARAAKLLGCDLEELAFTGSTTDGVNAVLTALELGPGDEVLTSDEEHPGVLAPLAVARERRGVSVSVAPFEELAEAVGPRTRLVACSHVSWMTGRVVDAAALAAAGAPVLLDGAQGLGAVPVDVRALACDFYAASGQKWLCGPNGIGYLYVRRDRAAELLPPWAGYPVLEDTANVLDLKLHGDARRFDLGFPAHHHVAWATAALDVLEQPGLDRVQARAAELAGMLAAAIDERGARVAPRGDTTLVSWEDPDPEANVERLRDQGFVVRYLPGTPYVRASVGAWNDESDLERLVAAAL
ncbi:MAG TPA: aminotransferase class V-fold PLP-dependent enzyme [Thermoleophilaceae bacterium]